VFHWYELDAYFANILNALFTQHGIANGPAVVPGPPPILTRTNQFELLVRLGELSALDNDAIHASFGGLSALMGILMYNGGWDEADRRIAIPVVTTDGTPERPGAASGRDGGAPGSGGAAGALAGGEN